MIEVQRRACPTCVYRKGSPVDPKALEDNIRDQRMRGHFNGYRICHSSKAACCRGFWNRHKDHFDLGQVAQRLGLVNFVVSADNARSAIARSVARDWKHAEGKTRLRP